MLETSPAPKKKVALMSYAIDNRPAKGTALYARKIIERFVNDKSFDVYLVHYDEVSDPIYKQAHEIMMPRLKLPFATRFVRMLLFFWKYRKDKFDIIHWFQPRVYPFYWFAPARHIVVTAHAAGDKTAPSFFNFSKLVFNFVFTYLHRWIDVAIAVSEYARQEIIKHYRFSPQKVVVTYNGGGEEFKPLPKSEAKKRVAEEYSITRPYILDVSRLQPHKNVYTLVKAYIEMREKYQERKEILVVVGVPVYDYESTFELAKSSKFSSDIVFVSYIKPEDLNAIYSAAEIFAFPSFNEGFGLPVIEAMASGTPVVTTTATSLPEVAGNAGLTVDPFDASALAAAMNRVLFDGGLRDDLIAKGVNWSKKFTWDKTFEETKKIYFSLLS